MKLPTGDKENLRGLGVTRTLVALVYSSGQGRFRPHANGGFEAWSDGVDLVVSFDPRRPTIEARHQIQYAAGFEFEATPKLTLLMDLLGRHILGAGQVGLPDSNADDASRRSHVARIARGAARRNQKAHARARVSS